MTEERRRSLAAGLAGGGIIQIETKEEPWVDFRGLAFTTAEIQEAIDAGVAEQVPMVRFKRGSDIEAFLAGKKD